MFGPNNPTFAEWYRALPAMDQPQFTDINGCRIVYCQNRQQYNDMFWLSDYAVSSVQSGCELVRLIPV